MEGMYHERPGIDNTDNTIDAALDYARGHGIKDIVAASTTGFTALKLFEKTKGSGINVVVVTHNYGFASEDKVEFHEDIRKQLTDNGICVHTGTMVLRSTGTAIRELMQYSQQDLIANTLRMFGQGMKVCVEIVAMAADSGLIPFADVLAIAGTGRGADTACLIKANSSNRFFGIKIKEIITKPKEF